MRQTTSNCIRLILKHTAVAIALIVMSCGIATRARADIAAPVAAPTAAVEVNGAHSVSSLAVQTLDGKPVDIMATPGYKVVYFYSAACPCVRSCETLSFIPLSQQYQGVVSFFAVTSGGWDMHDPRPNFLALTATHHLPFPVLMDPTHAVADKLGAQTASEAFLIAPNGAIIYSGLADDSKEVHDETGAIGKTHSYLGDAIAEAISGKPIAIQHTTPRGCSIAPY